jgi:hypothetical protein
VTIFIEAEREDDGFEGHLSGAKENDDEDDGDEDDNDKDVWGREFDGAFHRGEEPDAFWKCF